jgi:hypothetical protein
MLRCPSRSGTAPSRPVRTWLHARFSCLVPADFWHETLAVVLALVLHAASAKARDRWCNSVVRLSTEMSHNTACQSDTREKAQISCAEDSRSGGQLSTWRALSASVARPSRCRSSGCSGPTSIPKSANLHLRCVGHQAAEHVDQSLPTLLPGGRNSTGLSSRGTAAPIG